MPPLYARDHLDHVLATFGLILIFDELVKIVWGPAGRTVSLPGWLSTTVEILPGVPYPAYRFAIIVVGTAVALGLYWVVAHTRLGMWLRAGASNRRMISALGVNIERLFTLVFGLGVALAAMLVGVIDTCGRAYLPQVLKTFLSPSAASTAAPAMASMLIYVLMAALLVWRPTGLLGARN